MASKTPLPDVKVGGVTRLTTIDFPGCLAAVIFTQGCPWRCRYCYNSSLLDPTREAAFEWEEVLSFLKRRRGLLEGVVFSGGEPSLWQSLPDCMSRLRSMGFRVALHTNGAYPDRLSLIVRENLADWVAMDVKTTFDDYERITAKPGSGDAARRSLQILLQSSVEKEFRITVHPDLHSPQDLSRVCRELAREGVSRLVLQKCRFNQTLDPELRIKSFSWDVFIKESMKLLSGIIPTVEVR